MIGGIIKFTYISIKILIGPAIALLYLSNVANQLFEFPKKKKNNTNKIFKLEETNHENINNSTSLSI